MRGGTTGGTEVVARLLQRKYPHIPIGRLILLVDAVVIAASAIVYKNIQSALYAVILIYISSMIMDMLIYGRNKGKLLMIITKYEQEVADEIMRSMHRGVTMLDAKGAYTGVSKQVLLCAVRPSEVYMLRNIVFDRDPEAFIMITQSDDVIGEGFHMPENKKSKNK